jgi:hypothetical protein
METALTTRNNTDLAGVSSQRIDELLEQFLACQDVKKSSKDLYRRTLRQ